MNFLLQALAGQGYGKFHKVTDDLFHITAHIAHLGELGGLYLNKGRFGKPRQAAGKFGLADTGGADHQDILWQHFLAQVVGKLLAPPTVAQGNGHGALGLVLADNETIELGNNFSGGKGEHEAPKVFRW